MRIYSRSGPIPFTQFTFPDGQRHIEIQTVYVEDEHVWVETAIRNGDELLDVMLAKDALDMMGVWSSLNIRYLMGARMDRRISKVQPFTLQVIARILNAAGFRAIRVLDPHSQVTLDLLRAEAVRPVHAASCVLAHYHADRTVIVAPDAGAEPRVSELLSLAHGGRAFSVVQGRKVRDPQTGRLSGFAVLDSSRVQGKHCLILDDLCDGGGTFVGLAAALRAAGAVGVDLFVTHGIFSKGMPLDGIDTIYTTDSYQPVTEQAGAIVIRVDMSKGIHV